MKVECITLFGDKKIVDSTDLVFRPASYAIIVHEGKVLLCSTKSTGKYWFPGGAVKLGETLVNALRREVYEEAGIEVEIEKMLTFKEVFFYYDPKDEAYQNLSFFFLGRPKSLELSENYESICDDETEKPCWVDLNSLQEEDVQKGIMEVLNLIK